MANIKWKTQDAIDEEKVESLIKPTEDEIEKAKREVETINLLKDLGVIE